MARIHFRNKNLKMKNRHNKSSNKCYQKLILLSQSTLRDQHPAFPSRLTQQNQSMQFGDSLDLSSKMTMRQSGYELKSEQLSDIKPKNQMLGWMEISLHLVSDWINYFQISSMNMWINLCSGISFILSLHSSKRMLCSLQLDQSLNLENLSQFNTSNPRI